MATDYRMIRQGVTPLADYQRLQQEFEMQKQLNQARMQSLASGGQDPAAVKLANEIQKARAAGDMQRLNDLQMSAKLLDRGVLMSPEGGATVMQGYPDVLGTLKYGEQQGAEIAKSQYEPTRAGEVEAARLQQQLGYEPQIRAGTKAAEMRAEDLAKAQMGLGRANEQTRQMLDLIQQIEQSPGLEAVVGAPNPFQGRIPLIGNIPGSPAADFQAKLDQLGGKQFLEAFEILKGGGAITQIEGEKATNAIARMQTSQSEKAFREALAELRGIVVRASERAQAKAGRQELPPVFMGLDPMQESMRAIQQQQQSIGTSPMQRPELQGNVINWEDLP